MYYNIGMKKFRFKYSPVIWVLLCLVIALSLAGLGWNIFNFISFVHTDTIKTVLYAIVIALNAFLVFLAIAVATYGAYVIKDGNLYAYFGIIRSKYNVMDIVEITHFKKSDKLVAYFKDNKFTVIVISPSNYDDFVIAIREINKEIVFNKKIEGENTPDQ